MAAFAGACEMACTMPPVNAPPLWSCADSVPKRAKHQKEISDLRQRRVSDQEFQSLLSQGDDAGEQNRRGAKRGEQLRSRETRSPGIASNQSRTTMKKDPFTTSAESAALAGAGAPAWAGDSQRYSGKSAVLA